MNFLKLIIKKNKTIFNIFSWIKLYINFIYYTIFMNVFKSFPIKRNRIIIISYYGKGYGDNGKYICNELLKNKEQYEIIWATKHKFKNSLPEGIKYVRYKHIKFLYYLSTSKIWINNTRFNYGVRKRKKQYYIQTWHSSLRLKSIEKDAEKYLKKQYIKSAKRDSKLCNTIISGCSFSTNIYKKSFWYNGEILEIGTPRCDLFFEKNNNILNKVYDYFKINKAYKIILYAPTFRKNNINYNYFFDYNKFINNMNKESNKYVLLVRFHPNSNATLQNSKLVYNATNYPDMQELIYASKVLITDYSGCCFDAMIAKKACILYVKDLDEYLKNERNLYFSFDELPFKKIKDEEDLLNKVKNFNYEDYYSKIKEFNQKILNKEIGKSAQLIVERINKVINNEKI